MSVFCDVVPGKPDLVFTLNQQFREDPRENKISLGVGAYRDENGKPWLLPSVKRAEEIIINNFQRYNKEYAPQQGYPGFIKAAQEFLLGEGHPAIAEGRVATCQALSGTGSLHVAFCFLHENHPGATVYMPDCTWTNHYEIFRKVYGKDVGWKEYTYLQKDGVFKIDFESMQRDIRAAPNGSIFLIHASAHNPSGVDMTKEQYNSVLKIFQEKKHIALFDTAYQGFATGSFEDDGYAPRLFTRSGIECIIAQSFAKNFGMYGERIGACHIVHNGAPELTKRIQSIMTTIVRCTWSSSPQHGAYIVEIVGNDPELKKQFLEDVKTMANRIKKMRQMFYDELIKEQVPGNWENILTCIGMFTFTGLSPKQVEYMREKHALYIVPQGGRMTMSGLTEHNIPYVVSVVKDTVLNCKE